MCQQTVLSIPPAIIIPLKKKHTILYLPQLYQMSCPLVLKLMNCTNLLKITNHDLCFTETWLKDTVDSNAISIDHYSLIRKDRIRAQHSDVCMHVSDSLPTTIIPEYDRDDVEILWCKLRPRRPRGFLTLSLPPSTTPPDDDASITNHIIDILSKIESLMPNAAIIIAVISNASTSNKSLIKFV